MYQKKYAEELEDTDSSDPPSVSEDSDSSDEDSEVSTPEMIMLQRQLNTSNLGAQVENQSDTQSEHNETVTQSETLISD